MLIAGGFYKKRTQRSNTNVSKMNGEENGGRMIDQIITETLMSANGTSSVVNMNAAEGKSKMLKLKNYGSE